MSADNKLRKPSWDDAPEWAEYLAQDSDGEWRWYANKPHSGAICWLNSEGKSELAGVQRNPDWRETLERRPEPSSEQDGESATPVVSLKTYTYNCITLRDHFAGQALAGVVADPSIDMKKSDMAEWCYEMADEMLKAGGRGK